VNALGGLFGHRFDFHPAVLAGHDDRPAGRAIDDDAQIQLPGNRQPLLHEQPRHPPAFGAGLVRHERHAVDLIRQRGGFGRTRGELHASALPSPARVDLRFHDDGAAAEPLGDALRLGRVHDGFAGGHRHAVGRKELFGLILVNFHMRETDHRSVRRLSASSRCD
jgi:hypothetical protein